MASALVGNIPTNLYLILQAMAQRLITLKVFQDITRIQYLARNEETPAFQAEKIALFRPRGFIDDKGTDLGAGRNAVYLHRQVDITARTRFADDEAYRDRQWFINQTFGHLLLEEAIINAWHDYTPGADESGNALTTHPVKLLRGTDYEKPNPKDKSWGHCTLAFGVSYLLNVNRKYQ